ncbi:ribosomal RNA methyltransferase FtsJ domain-containing protein [Kockovaella imperatae]|uniref:rRNA methyltransferase 2, mitochondrial n=1 Tax=Kockovaella imperatae TaxID=4999 RepID=A0A1Y1U9R6_9TREE|nr:ribosomal RNA methyltransferase FtsJ domain-containing protein [Kockovaella imperatae]ORX33825.1 ribosomal RNA methyltransferase FtsJ domain-containing protein [Kockovaella imperatae]
MRATLVTLKKSASSTRWLARQANDPYVKGRIGADAGGVTYRSRSSFKLISLLDKRFPKVIVDLGAAPGGWSQVIRRKARPQDLVFALDILDMEPLKGVEVLKGDFLEQAIQKRLRARIMEGIYGGALVHPDHRDHRMVDLVLSDMMGPMTGNKLADVRTSLDLVEAASAFAFANLKEAPRVGKGDPRSTGGHLVIKFFMHPDMVEFQKQVLEPRFRKVAVPKPKESRKESSEAYFVCLGYKGDPNRL